MVCYRKGYERGLWFEIKCIEDVIKGKTDRGEDCKFEKKYLKELKGMTQRDYSKFQNDSREISKSGGLIDEPDQNH